MALCIHFLQHTNDEEMKQIPKIVFVLAACQLFKNCKNLKHVGKDLHYQNMENEAEFNGVVGWLKIPKSLQCPS